MMTERLRSCEGLQGAVELLAKRWTLLIVELLLQRPARFCELSRALPRLSERVLSERLKELVAEDLATREVDPGPPIAAIYALTSRGRQLGPVIEALRTWAAGAGGRPSAMGDEAIGLGRSAT